MHNRKLTAGTKSGDFLTAWRRQILTRRRFLLGLAGGSLADIVKVDILGLSEAEIRERVADLRPYGPKLLAEKIETREQAPRLPEQIQGRLAAPALEHGEIALYCLIAQLLHPLEKAARPRQRRRGAPLDPVVPPLLERALELPGLV